MLSLTLYYVIMLFINILLVFGVLATSFWVYLDAKQRLAPNELDGETNSAESDESMSPGSWFWVCLLLWIIGFPWYLYTRFKSPGPKGNKPAFLAIAGVLAVGTIALLLNAKISSEGPSIGYMQSHAMSFWNTQVAKAYGKAMANGRSSACTYSPSSWKPGYQFECFIYDSGSSQVGHVQVTVTNAPSGSYLWNWQAFTQ